MRHADSLVPWLALEVAQGRVRHHRTRLGIGRDKGETAVHVCARLKGRAARHHVRVHVHSTSNGRRHSHVGHAGRGYYCWRCCLFVCSYGERYHFGFRPLCQRADELCSPRMQHTGLEDKKDSWNNTAMTCHVSLECFFSGPLSDISASLLSLWQATCRQCVLDGAVR